MCEYAFNVCLLKGRFGWTEDAVDSNFVNDVQFAHDINSFNGFGPIALYEKTCADDEYMDFHNWIFTKSSFELLIYDLQVMGLINFKIVHMFETSGGEFIVGLKKYDDVFMHVPEERMRLQHAANKETLVGLTRAYAEREQNSAPSSLEAPDFSQSNDPPSPPSLLDKLNNACSRVFHLLSSGHRKS